MTEPPTEYFETFDDAGRPLGLVARAEVHARGLWHRSAHVFLFDTAGALWIQQRAAAKDLFPGRWDFTVGEHLTPGETFLQGALRGLAEELAIEGASLEAVGPVRRNTCRIDALGVLDRELQQAFRGCWDGPVQPDPAEVAAVRRVDPVELRHWMQRAESDFTPWFLSELEALPLLTSP